MALICVVRCSSCDFEIGPEPDRLLFLLDDEGEEVPCPHPGESWTAKEVTGLSIGELSRQKRLRSRLSLVCTDCGHLDYYGRDQLPVQAQSYGLRIKRWLASDWVPPLNGMPCRRCGSAALRRICHVRGQCPSCGIGQLKSKIWGKS